MSKRRELFKEPKKPVGPAVEADPESVVLTLSAAKEILRQGTKRDTPGSAIRVGIKGGGCSGYSYLFDWAPESPKDNDHVIEGFGAKVYVDPKSMKFLKGTILDFVSSITGHGFKFKNPNVTAACGCGESISF